MPESLDKQRDKVGNAFYSQYGSSPSVDPNGWVAEVFNNYVIASFGDNYYNIPYSKKRGEITFANREDWTEVEEKREWIATVKALKAQANNFLQVGDLAQVGVGTTTTNGTTWVDINGDPIKGPDTTGAVLYYGGAVKALGDGKIGGYLVRYGDPEKTDLVDDFFNDETDYGPHETSLVFYNHGLDDTLKRRVLDKKAQLKQDEVGVWIEAQLALRDAYEKFIYEQVEAGKMGWSSGTADYLVERNQVGKAYHITSWPLGLDASITPAPTEPRNSVIPLKSLSGLVPSIPELGDEPEAAGDAAGSDSERKEGNQNQHIQLRARALSVLD